MLKNLDLGPVSQKPWKSFRPIKPFLVIYILKTEKCIGLTLCMKGISVKSIMELNSSVIKRFEILLWLSRCENFLKTSEKLQAPGQSMCAVVLTKRKAGSGYKIGIKSTSLSSTQHLSTHYFYSLHKLRLVILSLLIKSSIQSHCKGIEWLNPRPTKTQRPSFKI